MALVTSFSPISDPSAEILILGSMPGVLSLTANQYYAHPRNGFWPIMALIYGFKPSIDYAQRMDCLIANKVAVWDVLQCCVRPGSLDSAIVNGSRIANDFEAFFKLHPNIQLVAFNGSEAEKSFNNLVLSKIENHANLKHIKFIRLPSTSPAHTLALQEKIEIWQKALFVNHPLA